jgi:predicted nucleic acid-binding protein
MIIVSDTTPISELAKVERLDLLPNLFGEVVVPQAVFTELQTGNHPAAQWIANEIPWLVVVPVENQALVAELQQSSHLDLGESEAIALAEEKQAAQLLIDEQAARRVALARNLPLIGTMGILMLAKQQDLIQSVKAVLDAMRG